MLMLGKGNVTTYQYKHGEEPLKIDRPSVDYTFEDEANNEVCDLDLDLDVGSIDFGDVSVVADAADSIQLETGKSL